MMERRECIPSGLTYLTLALEAYSSPPRTLTWYRCLRLATITMTTTITITNMAAATIGTTSTTRSVPPSIFKFPTFFLTFPTDTLSKKKPFPVRNEGDVFAVKEEVVDHPSFAGGPAIGYFNCDPVLSKSYGYGWDTVDDHRVVLKSGTYGW